MRFQWISSPVETVYKRSCLRNQNFILSSFLSWFRLTNAVRKFKIPEECCFLFRSKPVQMQILAPLWNPLGGRSLTLCHTSLDFRQSQNRTSGLAWACSVITKFFSSKKSVLFFRMIELTPSSLSTKRKFLALCGHRARKATIFFALSFVTTSCVSVWIERACARLIDSRVSWFLLLVNWSLTNQALRDWTWRGPAEDFLC